MIITLDFGLNTGLRFLILTNPTTSWLKEDVNGRTWDIFYAGLLKDLDQDAGIIRDLREARFIINADEVLPAAV